MEAGKAGYDRVGIGVKLVRQAGWLGVNSGEWRGANE